MKTPNPTKILSLILLFMAAQVSLSYAGNLFIEPYAPFAAVGGTISLSVTNADGSVKWKAFHGEIEKTGNSVKYKAPDKVTIDAVSAIDSTGNMGFVRVVVQEQKYIDELFSGYNGFGGAMILS
ncbi:MAG: hypothetical protein HQK70_15720 [Desulfamplus sp.]|nr:hypothetical protein [Desulfamplus sp.]